MITNIATTTTITTATCIHKQSSDGAVRQALRGLIRRRVMGPLARRGTRRCVTGPAQTSAPTITKRQRSARANSGYVWMVGSKACPFSGCRTEEALATVAAY